MNNHRKSLRLKHYDYSRAGLYFITICTQNRESFFGDIQNNKMVLNDAGKMIETLWQEIQNDFLNIALHEYIIMPNHLHGIIEITVGADSISAQNAQMGSKITVGADSISAQNAQMGSKITVGADSISAQNAQMGSELPKGTNPKSSSRADMESAPTKTNIPAIIQSFKRHTTIRYIQMVKQNIVPPFHKKIWQRNYWEHIIRNEQSYLEISEYIQNNPAKWAVDTLNSEAGCDL